MIVREKLTLILSFSIFAFLLFLTACQTQPEFDTFYYKVILEDENNHLIRNTEVKLDIAGAPTIITGISDDNGLVVFALDNKYKNKIADLFIVIDDYQSKRRVIEIDDNGRSNRLQLELSEANIAKIQTPIPIVTQTPPTSIPTSELPTMSTTPVPSPTEIPSSTPTNTPEPSPTSTQTPLPSKTPEPTPSNTPINSQTLEPTSTTPIFQVMTDLPQQTIYTIPSADGGKLGILANNQELTAKARTADSAWYLVEYSKEHDGWVEASTTTLIDGKASELPITTILPTETPSGPNPQPPTNCLTSWVDFQDDGAHIYWKNEYPHGTDYLTIEVEDKDSSGQWNSESFIEESTLDKSSPDLINYGYIIASWQFRNYGEFKYDLSAYGANNNLICFKTFYFTR